MSYAVEPDNSSDDTRKFHEMAIRSLVRRVRRNPERNALDNLIKAIKTKDMETECIRIPRSLDGRMQVRQKKTVPHVLYCKIWRWSDLKSYHEIHGILTCRYAYGKNYHKTVETISYFRNVAEQWRNLCQSVSLRTNWINSITTITRLSAWRWGVSFINTIHKMSVFKRYEYQHKLQSPIEPSFTCQIPQATHLTYDR